jgi:hypothetical protein
LTNKNLFTAQIDILQVNKNILQRISKLLGKHSPDIFMILSMECEGLKHLRRDAKSTRKQAYLANDWIYLHKEVFPFAVDQFLFSEERERKVLNVIL